MKEAEQDTFGFSPFELPDDHCKGSNNDQDHNYRQNRYKNQNEKILLLLLLLHSLARVWQTQIWIFSKTCIEENIDASNH